jgi:hypothetical protein
MFFWIDEKYLMIYKIPYICISKKKIMNIATQKSELVKWINSIEDVTILKKIEEIKATQSFDFEKEWARSITIEEARKKSDKFIKTLSWKK